MNRISIEILPLIDISKILNFYALRYIKNVFPAPDALDTTQVKGILANLPKISCIFCLGNKKASLNNRQDLYYRNLLYKLF